MYLCICVITDVHILLCSADTYMHNLIYVINLNFTTLESSNWGRPKRGTQPYFMQDKDTTSPFQH